MDYSERKPCTNNCGFFGISDKRNLCSKCYKDLFLEEELASMKSVLCSAKPTSPAEPSKGTAGPSKTTKRCGTCNKKVGLTGFVCKCGSTFCGVHRYPEKHKCTYDFKGEAREVIAKANPVVKADKIDRF